jgi:hypothetical protein
MASRSPAHWQQPGIPQRFRAEQEIRAVSCLTPGSGTRHRIGSTGTGKGSFEPARSQPQLLHWPSGLHNNSALQCRSPAQNRSQYEVIVHCWANPGKKVIEAIDIIFKDCRTDQGIRGETTWGTLTQEWSLARSGQHWHRWQTKRPPELRQHLERVVWLSNWFCNVAFQAVSGRPTIAHNSKFMRAFTFFKGA